jgi:hypothetical protein
VRYAIEATIFPGLLLLAGFAAFLFAKDRRRLPLLIAAAVLYVFGLGPSLKVAGHFVWKHGGTPVSFLPYRVLLAIPGLGALRAPVRVEYVLVALLVAMTAIALERVPRSRAWIVGAVAAVLLATNLLVPVPTTTFGTTSDSEQALRAIAHSAHRGDTVLSVPADCDPAFVSLQVFHHAPVVGCAGSFAANPWSKMRAYTASAAFTKLRCDRTTYGRLTHTEPQTAPFDNADVAALRRDFGVRFLVVDRSKLQQPHCASVATATGLFDGYTTLGGDDRYAVIDLAPDAGQ